MDSGNTSCSTSTRGYLAEKGWWSWAYTLDHKRIGVMYLLTTLVFFFVGGLFAMILRMKLLTPGPGFISDHAYNVVFTMHGTLMIFLFIIPAIPSGLGNFFIPLMVGARDVAFPRLNILSFWIFIAGILVILGSLGSPMDTGWTFYTPYSAKTSASVTVLAFGIFLVGMSSILTGINFIVTIHRLRAPGMTWSRLPLFIWGMYATSIIQVLATPVIGITFLLLAAERIFGIGFFDPAKGGDPVLFQHFFWFYSHPVVYVMILPAMGIITEIIPVFSRKPIFGYKAIAFSSLAIAFIGFLVWGHHMFVSGMSGTAGVIFSFLTFFVAVPTGIKVFNWIATMY
ncbi:MAG TPA: cbb3-type cytochrome c oxidase subunit I, partial [Geobacteraceae bacterium]